MDAIEEKRTAGQIVRIVLRVLVFVIAVLASLLGAYGFFLMGVFAGFPGLSSPISAEPWYVAAALTLAAGALACAVIVRPGRWAIRPGIVLGAAALATAVVVVVQLELA